MFPHKDIHTQTWMSPDCSYSNQIDHNIMVNVRFTYNITNVRICSASDSVVSSLASSKQPWG